MDKPTPLRKVKANPDELDDEQRVTVAHLRSLIERVISKEVTAIAGVVVRSDEDGDETFERLELGEYVNGPGVAASLNVIAREAEEFFGDVELVDPFEPNEGS